MAEVERTLRTNRRVALCEILRTRGSTPGKPGWRLLVRADGSTFGNLGGGAFEALVAADAQRRLELRPDREAASKIEELQVERYYLTERAVKGEPTGMVCGGFAEVLFEVVSAPPVLAICGAGPVGQSLAQAAALAGFELVVADDRADFRRPELFPEATALVEVDREYSRSDLSEDRGRGGWLGPWLARELYVAVVSRCWETDAAAVASVLRQRPPHLFYLGLMGSRRKIERVEAELGGPLAEPQGWTLRDVPFRAPIGLPLGGDTPGEIAVAVTAELVRMRHGGSRSGSFCEGTTRKDRIVVGA